LSPKLLVAALFAVLVSVMPAAAQRSLVARIDIGSQRMSVEIDGMAAYDWPVSTGRRGYRTPTGSFRPGRMYRRYFSRKYDNSPMPYAIFFRGGYAVHGTGYIRSLGRPASHGCVRLHPANAATLYALVGAVGKRGTRIIVTH
jgi:lipoprotein-anchoring transpeptidase ErfK/SrfK